jgi:prevent-host-death family protein
MSSEIPVTQAREELADLVNRVAYGHERIVLTRHSRPVACLVAPEDLARLEELEQQEQREQPVGTLRLASAPPANMPAPGQPAAPSDMPLAARYQQAPQPGGRPDQ